MKYKILREVFGCGAITAGIITFLNFIADVPNNQIVFMNVIIEIED